MAKYTQLFSKVSKGTRGQCNITVYTYGVQSCCMEGIDIIDVMSMISYSCAGYLCGVDHYVAAVPHTAITRNG